ncbi:MAG: YqeB family protein [Brevibacterium yomogidense]
MSASSTTITLDRRLAPVFIGVGAAAGLALAFIAGPVTAWLLDRVDSAPVFLRIVDEVPLFVTLPALTVIGALAGWIVFAIWEGEVGTVILDADGVLITKEKSSARFTTDEIAEAFLDGDELVLVDDATRELSRTASDNGLEPRLRTAFGAHGVAWRGREDPRGAAFHPWIDRGAELDAEDHALLRARQRALTDKRAGEAAALRDQLRDRDIVVRDRDEAQQIRRITG